MPAHDDQHPSHRSAGTSFDDFTRARSAFFETLRRDSEFRRIAACWDDAAPHTGAAHRGATGAEEHAQAEPAAD
jgi:hypothetical protein